MDEVTVVVVAGFALAVVWAVGRSYWLQKEIEGRRRYVDIGATCAVAAGFALDGCADGPKEPHPSRTFTHTQHPDLFLQINSSGWYIRENLAAGLLPLPEPK